MIQTQAQEKADPTGTWTWTTAIPPAGQAWSTPARVPRLQRKTTLRLKIEGGKLIGTIYTQLSQPHTNAVPITDAKLDGDIVSFTVTRELNGKQYVQKFSGKVSGDTIKGKVEFERDGQPRSADWVARRVVEGNEEPGSGHSAPGGFRSSRTNSPALRPSPRPTP